MELHAWNFVCVPESKVYSVNGVFNEEDPPAVSYISIESLKIHQLKWVPKQEWRISEIKESPPCTAKPKDFKRTPVNL
jgi:hypothetical protein